MARAPSSIVIFFRQSLSSARQNICTQIRKLTVVPKELEFDGEGIQPIENHELPQSVKQQFTDVAKEVAKITRTKPKWEQTILSDFPSFNFTDPRFFCELLKQQNNAFLSLEFFHWLRLHSNFEPDQVSCNVLFDSLLEAKACSAAKNFLEVSNFFPEQDALERYICCLCETGFVEDALEVFAKFKEIGVCPSIVTWNAALSGCLNVGRADLVWKFYHDMMESGVITDIDVNTVEYLIRAFCIDGQVLEGYELLRQVLENGFIPKNIAFNALISGFSKQGNYDKVSELLHIMIAKNYAPDIYTYQGIISGLWENKLSHEAQRIFNDLKDRGYAPDTVMYTTMIRGLCEMGCLGDARKLWFEMINKGILPNECTYNALIDRICKNGEFEEARMLFNEMRGRGFGEMTATYKMMITNLCLHGRVSEAFDLFEEMLQKGIVPDVMSYNLLISAFCKEGKIVESKNIFNQLLAHGLQPSKFSFSPLIRKLCKVGDINEVKQFWNDMQNRGLKPFARDYDRFITLLCKQGHVVEGIEWLAFMLKNKQKPEKETIKRLVQCLLQSERSDESLFAFTFIIGHFLKIGYAIF